VPRASVLTGSGKSWHKDKLSGDFASANAFDNNSASLYHANTNNTAILGYEFDDSVSVLQVYIEPRASAPAQSPEDFTLQYSADGVNWTTALTVTGQTGWTSAARTFNV
jgi:hypothetical protein